MTVFFHAIVHGQPTQGRRTAPGWIAIYRDTHQSDDVTGIAEPVTRIRIEAGQDPHDLIRNHGWDLCGEPTRRGSMLVVPIQPSSWSRSLFAS